MDWAQFGFNAFLYNKLRLEAEAAIAHDKNNTSRTSDKKLIAAHRE